jgi:hypothetical protein
VGLIHSYELNALIMSQREGEVPGILGDSDILREGSTSGGGADTDDQYDGAAEQ